MPSPRPGRAAVALIALAAGCLSACGGGGPAASGGPHGATPPAPTTTTDPLALLRQPLPSFASQAAGRPTDVALVGTREAPALTEEGDTVVVETPAWRVHVAVSGPTVPGEGLPVQHRATTCTWTVTLWGATAPVPVSAADFDSTDTFGDIYRMSTVGSTPPPVVRPGQRVTFRIRTVELVGEGLMRWAPDRRHVLAKWDFIVEND